MNNDNFENKENGSQINMSEGHIKNISEADNDNEDNKALKGGGEENRKVAEDEKKADESKEQESGKEEKNDSQEGRAGEQDGEGSNIGEQNSCSTHYAPPYYVPNFTVGGESSIYNSKTEESKEKKKSSSFGRGTVLALCAVTLALAVILGSVAGAFFSGKLPFAGNGDYSGRVVNILKSDREITVEESSVNVGDSNLTVAEVAGLVGESVVEITTTQVQSSWGYGQYIQSGAGSGVVISFDEGTHTGYIVTNFHVINGADDVTVRIKEKTKNGELYHDYSAIYIAGSPSADIAVLSVKTKAEHKLKCAVFANDSEALTVGEQVVAIGNPLGQLGGTVTDGIISALDREIIVENYPMVLLQTNAAINPGNSGGGLFNMSGELIGIVNAKQSDTGIEGLGFAIPSNVVRTAYKDLLELGYISGQATLGIEVQYGSLYYMGGSALYVTGVGQTTLKQYDRITKIGNVEITSLSDYYVALKRLRVGESVEVSYVRNGVESKTTLNVKEDTTKYKMK